MIIAATVTCGSGSATVQFQVGNFAEANVWTLASYPEASLIQLDTAIKQGDAAPGEARFSVEGRNGAFSVNKEIIQFYPSKQPTAQLKASDLGIAVGTKIYIFTVQKDGQFLSVLPAPTRHPECASLMDTFMASALSENSRQAKSAPHTA